MRLLRTLFSYGAALGLRGVETLGKLGLYIYAAHVLGAHDAGLFFLCLTWIGLAATIARLGLDKAMTRHIAAELAVGDGPAARRVLIYGLSVSGAAALLAAGLTAVIAQPAATHLFSLSGLGLPLMLSAIVILPQTLAFALGAALAGLGRGVAAQLVQNALWPVLTFLALLLWIDSIDGLILALGVSLAISCLLGFALLLRDRHRLAETHPQASPPDPMPGLWETALPLMTVEITQVVLASLPVLVLGIVADAATVGAFSIASRISMLVWVIIISIATLAAPRFASLHRLGRIEEL
ncbi:MAG: oligosaccharide flippase family protein, partial [Alphaproteobacteria bacterium]|nr:oligosaccharide flippase family protein [Alphaproteobacteria bacterium]